MITIIVASCRTGTDDAGGPPALPDETDGLLVTGDPTRGWQRQAAAAVEDKVFQGLDPAALALLESQQGPFASRVLTARRSPNSPPSHLFRTVLLRRRSGQDGGRQCGPDTASAAAAADRKHGTEAAKEPRPDNTCCNNRRAVSPRSPVCGRRDRHSRPEPETTKGRTSKVETGRLGEAPTSNPPWRHHGPGQNQQLCVKTSVLEAGLGRRRRKKKKKQARKKKKKRNWGTVPA